MNSSDIRKAYIDFFVQKHGHTFVPSSSVVPLDDPTLLFTNAGMNQFKPIFLGQEKRAYTRAANTQKCIRAGGKHNDLDDVGRSRRHHTFFEMLGNWSFGDYFKRGAIEMAWELLTVVWKLDPERLHVTCFIGDAKNGGPRDTEAAALWGQVAKLPDDHIHYFGKDNFWEMGDTGPCGPCTEIYYDRTPDKTGGPQVNGDDPRVMEIWNNVFIQYNRNADRTLTVLPSQHVDTGMGFERICQVLQNVDSNYSIDLWDPFWKKLHDLSGHTYSGKFPRTNTVDAAAEAADEGLRKDIAFRVIADHIRCLTFALTDGAVPDNEGRGYVLRRILRRAVRFGRQQLGLRETFLHTLVPVVVEAMGDSFGELRAKSHDVQAIIESEEASFGRTLERGIQLFEEAATRGDTREIAAGDAFKLHDTFGFPIDLTRIMAEERGMTVDVAGYEALMEEAREKARAGGKDISSPVFDIPPAVLAQLESAGVARTDDSPKFTHEPSHATVRAIWTGEKLSSELSGSESGPVAVVLDRTNFYAEMGGQVGDTGRLLYPGLSFDVQTTRAVGKFVLHIGQLTEGTLRTGDKLATEVSARRLPTQLNHTGTHLANWALREVLGDGVQQKGSLVDPEKLRFDFSHSQSLTDDEIARVESLVNTAIDKQLAVYAEEAPQDQAMKINGLRAVFGEKYPPRVRVVSVGVPVADLLNDPGNPKWRGYSIEFCGGTHTRSSTDISHFVITGEESVSKGVRRLIAFTGLAASAASETAATLSRTLDEAARAPESRLPHVIERVQKQLSSAQLPLLAKRQVQHAVASLQQKYKSWEKANQRSTGQADTAALATDLLAQAFALSAGACVIANIADATDDTLRAVLDSLKKREPSVAALLATSDGAKLTFIAIVSDEMIAKGLKAGDWVKEAAKASGGGGGGRPNMAQAGGKDPAKLEASLAAAREYAQRFA